ncbi:MAG: hypothetical protein RLZZ535_105 [Cyanobacteriota bacterium]
MTTTLIKTDINSPLIINKPEIQLLLGCARTQVDELTQVRIKNLVEQEIDWNYLILMAKRHGLIPLLFYNLNKLCREAVPQPIFSDLEQYFKIHTRRSLILTNELLQILDIFKANNIQAIPFKGSTLAISAYKSLALRQFCDLDILIDKQDTINCLELLTSIGYSLPKFIDKLDQKPYIKNYLFLESDTCQKGYDLIHETKNIAIDLQWSLTEKRKSKYFSIDLQNLKNNLTYINIAGRQIAQFSNEDMLLFLCFHGSKHCWQSLRWICDVAEFIQAHPHLDWQKVEMQAKELKCQTMLWLTLFLVSDLLATSLPNDLLVKMQTKHRAYLLAQKVYELIFSRNFTQWEDYLFIFSITDSWRGKYQFITSLLFTPTEKEWKFFKLHNSLTFLYYFIRPFRLIKEYLGASHFSVK